MSKISRIVVGALAVAAVLGLSHAWLNLGFDPARLLGSGERTQVAEETRFRVGFLPVT
jgi:hypothetical protein